MLPRRNAQGFVSAHDNGLVTNFEYFLFYIFHELVELQRQARFVEAKAMYFPNSKV
jgi:hypothetical protein